LVLPGVGPPMSTVKVPPVNVRPPETVNTPGLVPGARVDPALMLTPVVPPLTVPLPRRVWPLARENRPFAKFAPPVAPPTLSVAPAATSTNGLAANDPVPVRVTVPALIVVLPE